MENLMLKAATFFCYDDVSDPSSPLQLGEAADGIKKIGRGITQKMAMADAFDMDVATTPEQITSPSAGKRQRPEGGQDASTQRQGGTLHVGIRAAVARTQLLV